jgi:predicted nucleic acid-binding protein
MLRVDEKTLEESWNLYKERSDVNLSFTDATCVVLAKTHGISDIFTYNAREFRPFNLNIVTSL